MIIIRRGTFAGPAVTQGCADATGREVTCTNDPTVCIEESGGWSRAVPCSPACFDAGGTLVSCAETPGTTPGKKKAPPVDTGGDPNRGRCVYVFGVGRYERDGQPCTPAEAEADAVPPRSVPWWAWLAGGVGLVALGVGFFGGRR